MGYIPKTLGILGGGPAARMTAMAAARLGVQVCLLTQDAESAAAQIVPHSFVGPYGNRALLKDFAGCVDVMTCVDDSVPLETIRALQTFKPVYPDDRVHDITRDRLRQRQFLNTVGIPTLPWAEITHASDIAKTLELLALDRAVLKPAEQHAGISPHVGFAAGQDAKAAWRALSAATAIMEEDIKFSCEISVIVARDLLGQTASYGPIQNEYSNGLLQKSTLPAHIPAPVAANADRLALFAAEALDLVGVLCVTFFVTADGRLLVHRLTPRPHESGYMTMDCGLCSQFEQLVRAACGMQVGSPARHRNAVTHRLDGSDPRRLSLYMEMPNAAVHLYGKPGTGENGEIGHVTILDSSAPLASNTVLKTPDQEVIS